MGFKQSSKLILEFPIPLNISELEACTKGPRILVNSMPKSGTHLLKRVFDLSPMLVSRWTHSSALTENTKNLYSKIGSIRKGQYVLSHLHWNEQLSKKLITNNIKTIFIIRDPRDQLISDALFITYKHPEHRLHSYFKSLETDEQRIRACIEGIEGSLLPDGKSSRPLLERLRRFMPWLDDPTCLAIRFEDLVGGAGGGDDKKQLKVVASIFNHVQIKLEDKKIEEIAKNIYFKHSHTFRKGTIGDWPNYLNEENKSLLKESIGNYLIKLGYAQNLNW